MTRPINPWKVTGYKAGQNVVCRVTHADRDGYAVVIPKDNLPGFIKTTATLKPGEEILAQFVCVHNNRVLLSPIFQGKRGQPGAVSSNINWQEHMDDLDQLDQVIEQRTQEHVAYRQLDEPDAGQQPQGGHGQPIITPSYSPGQTHAASQQPGNHPQQSPAQSAGQQQFAPPGPIQDSLQAPQYQQQPEAQWQAPQQHLPTKRFRLRRAIDLVMPPTDDEGKESLKTFRIADYDMEWLLTDIEGGMRTGCIKATVESKLSRSAALLYRGRAVGCIFGCKANPDAKPTEESLSMMLSDLETPDAMITIYDLPEDITLSMSALFLGLSIDREDNLDSRSYFDYVMNWFIQNSSTACVAITLPSTKSTYLIFVAKGHFCGAFFVEEQQFTMERSQIYHLFEIDANARVEASLLSQEMVAPGQRFGYSLSMARQKRTGF